MDSVSSFLNHFLQELLELIPSIVHNIFYWVKNTRTSIASKYYSVINQSENAQNKQFSKFEY